MVVRIILSLTIMAPIVLRRFVLKACAWAISVWIRILRRAHLCLMGLLPRRKTLVKAEGGIALVELLHTSISGRFYGCVLERLATSCCHTQWIALACAWLTRGSCTRVLRDLLRTICEHAILPSCFEERRLRQRSLRISWPHVW